ncbi:hypothetical protein E2C01_034938 [Portunus trituberculatus]|uniref:Uncharacterized protein n=1 Tax=Portunus trituberculatus TaxID=210409 RepID=A0A5B7F1V6_PORTR|nr:hypothetical protein [Portunus trituberculatus]
MYFNSFKLWRTIVTKRQLSDFRRENNADVRNKNVGGRKMNVAPHPPPCWSITDPHLAHSISAAAHIWDAKSYKSSHPSPSPTSICYLPRLQAWRRQWKDYATFTDLGNLDLPKQHIQLRMCLTLEVLHILQYRLRVS